MDTAVSTLLACAARIPDNLRFKAACFSARLRWPAPKREASEMASPVNSVKRLIAYFSMEIALENAMPCYSGGLGVLAGDTIRAAADLRLPMVAVSLLYRKGFFTQRLSEDGSQTEEPVEWRVGDFLTEEPARATVCEPTSERRCEKN